MVFQCPDCRLTLFWYTVARPCDVIIFLVFFFCHNLGQELANCVMCATVGMPSNFQWPTAAPSFTYQFCYYSQKVLLTLAGTKILMQLAHWMIWNLKLTHIYQRCRPPIYRLLLYLCRAAKYKHLVVISVAMLFKTVIDLKCCIKYRKSRKKLQGLRYMTQASQFLKHVLMYRLLLMLWNSSVA